MSLFHYDAQGNISIPDVYLQKRNLETIGLLFVTGLTVTENLNDFRTVSFEVPRLYQGKENPCYDALETLQLVYLPPHGHFSISVETSSDGQEVKKVSGTSWETELDSRYLDDFQVNTFEEGDETDAEGNYVRSHLFDESDQEHSILHRALSGTGWSLQMGGSSEEYAKLCGRYPTYDLSRQSVRSFLTSLQEEYELLFLYGKEARTITCYLLSDYGRDTGIYASFENLNQQIQIETDEDAIVTALRVSGGEGIYTEDVVPAPSGQLICLDYFLDPQYMSQETIDAWNAYTTYYNNVSETYSEKLLVWDEKNTLLQEYLHSTPQSQTKEEDGTLAELNQLSASELTAAFSWKTYPSSTPAENRFNYGQAYLKAVYDAYEEAKSVRVQEGHTKDAPYEQILRILDASRAALDQRKSQIDALNADIQTVNQQKAALRQSCDIRTRLREYFSSEGLSGEALSSQVLASWNELQAFIREEEYSNDNYFATDLDSYADRMEITKELLAQAQKELNKNCRPHVTWNCTVFNPALRKDFDFSRETLELGNFMTLEMHEGYAEKIRIIGAEIPYDKPEELRLTFADRVESDSAVDDIGRQIGSATSAAASFQSIAAQKDNYDSAYQFIQEMIQHGLNAALAGIYNDDNQEITIDRYGLWGRARKTAGDFEPEQILIQKNKILFTDDYWKTIRSALGKIEIKNTDGSISQKYGLIADTVLVDDLYALGATIGQWVIDAGALRSPHFRKSEDNTRVLEGTYLGADGSILTPNLQLIPGSGLTIDVNSFHLNAGGSSSGITLEQYLENIKTDTITESKKDVENLCTHTSEENQVLCLHAQADGCVRLDSLLGNSIQEITPSTPGAWYPIASVGDCGYLELICSKANRNFILESQSAAAGGEHPEIYLSVQPDLSDILEGREEKSITLSCRIHRQSLAASTSVHAGVTCQVDYRGGDSETFSCLYEPAEDDLEEFRIQESFELSGQSIKSITLTCQSNSGSVSVSEPKLELGAVEHTIWTPAPEDLTSENAASLAPLIQKVKLSLSEPLRSLGDERDEIVEQDGEFGILRRVHAHTFTGEEAIAYQDGVFSFTPPLAAAASGTCLSNYYAGAASDSGEDLSLFLSESASPDEKPCLCFRDSRFSSAEDFQSWLTSCQSSSVPLMIQYPLETPVFQVFAKAEQDALRNLRSYEAPDVLYVTERLPLEFRCSFKTKLYYESYQTQQTLFQFENAVNSSFRDGIISESEILILSQQLNYLSTDKTRIDQEYVSLTGKENITEVTRQSLDEIKDQYDTAYENLTDAVRQVSQDRVVTLEEKADIDQKFTLYKEALQRYTKIYQSSTAEDITGQLKSNTLNVSKVASLLSALELKKNEIMDNQLDLDTIPAEYKNAAYQNSTYGAAYQDRLQLLLTSYQTDAEEGYCDRIIQLISSFLSAYQEKDSQDFDFAGSYDEIQTTYTAFLSVLSEYNRIRRYLSESAQSQGSLAHIQNTLELDDRHVSFLLSELNNNSFVLTICADAMILSKDPIWTAERTGFSEEELENLAAEGSVYAYFTSRKLRVAESHVQNSTVSDSLQIGNYVWEKRMSLEESGSFSEHLSLSFKNS